MKLTLKAFKEGAIPFSFFAFKSPDELASRCIMDTASPVDKYIEWIRSTDTKVEDKGEYFVLLLDVKLVFEKQLHIRGCFLWKGNMIGLKQE